VVEDLVKKIPGLDGFRRFIAFLTKAPEPDENTPLSCTKLFNNNFNTLRTGSFKLFKRPFPGVVNNFNP